MVHMGMKVERQLKQKGSTRVGQNSGSTSSWKPNWSKRDEMANYKSKAKLPKHKNVGSSKETDDDSVPPSEGECDGEEYPVNVVALVTR